MVKKKQGGKQKKIITHNGNFHADDVFAVAVVFKILKKRDPKVKIKVVRTRDEKEIKTGDYVLDVGGVHNPSQNRFDHHQEGGAGKRSNGIPYAAFGLVWKKSGKTLAGSKEVAEEIDRKLVQPIDALDNGVEISKSIFPGTRLYTIQDFISLFNPSWKEVNADVDTVFFKLIPLAETILEREILKIKHKKEAEKFVKQAYKKSPNKKIIVLGKNYPWTEILVNYKSPLFVVYPSRNNESWRVRTVPEGLDTFKNRKDFPVSWAGKSKDELVKITGVSDALHCHNKRFIASAETKVGAIKLANLALKQK